MPDEVESTAKDERKDEYETVQSNQDWLLTFLVEQANYGITLAVILIINGTVISGKLISGRQYFETLASHWRKSFERPGFEKLVEQFDHFFAENAKTYPDLSKDAGDGEVSNRKTVFIHLDEARIFSPGQRPMPVEGMLWRGRLTEVSGFSLGMFGTTSELSLNALATPRIKSLISV